MALFWLSFVDRTRAPGSRFLGTCLVEAPSFQEAIQVAWRNKCNPGGEVRASVIGAESEHLVDPAWRNRLLTWKESEACDAEIDQRIKAGRSSAPD